jgi:hypothetical protein
MINKGPIKKKALTGEKLRQQQEQHQRTLANAERERQMAAKLQGTGDLVFGSVGARIASAKNRDFPGKPANPEAIHRRTSLHGKKKFRRVI